MAVVYNVHERRIDAPASAVGALLETLGSPGDRLWPLPPRDPMVLRHPRGSGLAIGARGGHGPVRYAVESYEPGRRVVFRMADGLPLSGRHALTVEPLDDSTCLLRHELEVVPLGVMRLLAPVVLSMHDCYVEDAFDRAELELGVGPASEHRHSLPVRLFERRLRRRVTASEPALDDLGATALPRIDFTDAYRTDLLAGDGTDPAAWASNILAAVPNWVRVLMRMPDVLMRPFGIRTADKAPSAIFPLHVSTDTEAVLGIDDRHLDFRLIATVDERQRSVTITTVVHLHSRLGRLYWSVVRFIHPFVLRSLMRRAAHPAGQANSLRLSRLGMPPERTDVVTARAEAENAGCRSDGGLLERQTTPRNHANH